MKSILVGPKEKTAEQSYPFIGMVVSGTANLGCCVLFSSAGRGSVIHEARKDYGLGYYCTSWQMQVFEPMNGKLTLHN